MADRIVQEIEVVAKVDDAIRKIDRLEADFKESMRAIRNETKKTSNSQEKLSNNITAVGKSLKTAFAAGTTIAFIKRAADLSRDYNRTTIALTQTLANLNREFELKELQEFASEMESLSGISDEVIRQFLLIGANANITGEALKALVRGSLGLSSALGRDATTMMQNLIKTLAGFKEESVKTIPEIASLTSAQLKAGDAIVEVDKKYSKFINTLSGPEGSLGKGVTDLEVSFDNLTESIGNALGDVGLGFLLTKAGLLIEHFGKQVHIMMLRIKAMGTEVGAALVATATGVDDLFGGILMGGGDSLFVELADSLGETNAKIAKAQKDQDDIFARLFGLERPGKDKKKPGKMDFPTFGVDDDDAVAKRKQLEEDLRKSLLAFDRNLTEEEEKFHQDRQDKIAKRIDDELSLRHSALDRRMELELSLARFQDQQLQEEEQRLAKQEQVYTDFYNKLGGVALDFTNASIDALFAQRDGEKHAFKEMLKNFLNFTGSKMIASGLQDSYEGASMIVTGDPRGAAKLGLGVAQVAIGTGMKAGSLAVKVPETGAASTAGVGGSQAATSRGGDTGPARAASINIFGAMTTEESAILIERGMRQAHARGFA